MEKIKNIELQFHCTEKTNDKLFCEKCAHKVIDFTQKTNKELSVEIERSKGVVCGRFKRSQLSSEFLKYAAATVVATSFVTLPAFGQQTATAIEPATLAEGCNGVEPENDDHYFQGIVVSRQAEPVGGFDKFYEDLYKAIQLPSDFRSSGKVIVGITIDERGNVTRYAIVRGIDKQVDAEVLRVVKSLNYSFIPGKQGDTPVPVRLVIPVIIDAEKKE